MGKQLGKGPVGSQNTHRPADSQQLLFPVMLSLRQGGKPPIFSHGETGRLQGRLLLEGSVSWPSPPVMVRLCRGWTWSFAAPGGERSSSPPSFPRPFAPVFVRWDWVWAGSWDRRTARQVQKGFLPQLGCFQARAGPGIRRGTCRVVQAFSRPSSEGRALRAMAGAGLSWGGWETGRG